MKEKMKKLRIGIIAFIILLNFLLAPEMAIILAMVFILYVILFPKAPPSKDIMKIVIVVMAIVVVIEILGFEILEIFHIYWLPLWIFVGIAFLVNRGLGSKYMEKVEKALSVTYIMWLLLPLVTNAFISFYPDDTVNTPMSDVAIEIDTSVLFATDEFLYAMDGSITCLNWKGYIIWQTPFLGGTDMKCFDDGFLLTVYNETTKSEGIMRLDSRGHILWQKEIGYIPPEGVDASEEFIVVASMQNICAFSQTGDVLWTYEHPAKIEEVAVAPDSSCAVFADKNSVYCVRDGDIIWTHTKEEIEIKGQDRWTLAFTSDSSLTICGFKDTSEIFAYTRKGELLWSTQCDLSKLYAGDDFMIVLGKRYAPLPWKEVSHLYKFTDDGERTWKREVEGHIDHVAITPNMKYIVVGCSKPTLLKVLNGEGELLWYTHLDTIRTVAISPDGNHIWCSNSNRVYHFSNPPEGES